MLQQQILETIEQVAKQQLEMLGHLKTIVDRMNTIAEAQLSIVKGFPQGYPDKFISAQEQATKGDSLK
jgi:hypothetical protein